jgi:cytosine/adenosine deaminase-related metal-dependent hydrolase
LTTIYSAKYLLPISSPPLEKGALLVHAGRIQAVGPLRDILALAPATQRIDFPEGILLPPLANAHTHLELTDFPLWAKELGEVAESDDFVGWIERVIRVKRGIAAERFEASVAHGIQAALRAGTGAVGDILSQYAARTPHRTSPFYGRLFFEALGRQAEPVRRQRLLIDELLREGACGRLQPGLAPHAPYTVAANYLEELFQLAREKQLPCTMHLAESADETAFLRDASGPLATRLYPLVGWGEDIPPASGLSPVAYLAARGGVAAWNLLVHGVHLDAADVAQLAAAGTTVVLCPRSNARLQVGVPPLSLYHRAGIRLALGTDSLASNDSLSLWDELACAWPSYSSCLSAGELLEIATRNGAAALGLEGEMGLLEPGYGAHFQVVKCQDEPAAVRLPEYLCEQAAAMQVSNLLLDGKECLPIPG